MAWILLDDWKPPRECYCCKHYAERHADKNGCEHFYARHGVCLVLAKATNPDGTEHAWACKGSLFESCERV